MATFADHMEKIAEGITEGYQKIENGVLTGYKKIENAFVNTFMAKEGESAEDTKSRVAAEQKSRIEASLDVSRKAGKKD